MITREPHPEIQTNAGPDNRAANQGTNKRDNGYATLGFDPITMANVANDCPYKRDDWRHDPNNGERRKQVGKRVHRLTAALAILDDFGARDALS
jgi:hypothetical protein